MLHDFDELLFGVESRWEMNSHLLQNAICKMSCKSIWKNSNLIQFRAGLSRTTLGCLWSQLDNEEKGSKGFSPLEFRHIGKSENKCVSYFYTSDTTKCGGRLAVSEFYKQ